MRHPGYITVNAAAHKWGHAWATVKQWCVDGRIPGVKARAGRYFIPANAEPVEMPPLSSEQRAEIKRRQMAGRKTSASSGYRGVYKRRNNKWAAIIGVGGKPVHIGQFATAKEAALAWDARARELRGPDTWVNFPDGRTDK